MLGVLDEQTILSDLAEALQERALRVMAELDLEAEVSLVLCDDKKIQSLNQQWRNIDKPTDVLSFPQEDYAPSAPFLEESAGALEASEVHPPPMVWAGDVEEGYLEPMNMFPRMLGDVVISVETCVRQAEEMNHTPLDEATRLWIHGLLHLLGYDHQTEEEALAMRQKEEELLKAFEKDNRIKPLVQTQPQDA